jgi:tetratricopeptide (TPR) repeat protein/DNA-binding winged helix-turn-helix (wHTH) protein
VEQVARTAHRLRFGVYEIDILEGELRKGGSRINLQDQPFQVLVLLLANPGKLVTREDLQGQIWPADMFVDFDLGLNTSIKKIRAALGDSADNPKFIETVPKRGYRFIYPVEVIQSALSAPVVEGTAATAPTFHGESSSDSPLPALVAAGARLARYRWWLVVAVALMASVLIALRTVSQSKEAGSSAGQPIESPAVRSNDRIASSDDRGTHDSAAFDAYLNGQGFMRLYDMPEKYDSAIESFNDAVRHDASYADAYAGLGQAFWAKHTVTGQADWQARAEQACAKAMDLDSQRPASRICLGVLHNGAGQYELASGDFSKAVELDSGSADAYRGRALAYKNLNKTVEAEKDYRRAIELDPKDWHGTSALASLYMEQVRYHEAIQQYELARAVRPDNSELLYSLGAVYVADGQYDRAVAAFRKALALSPSSEAYQNLGTALLDEKHFDDAIDSFRKGVQYGPKDYRAYGNLARGYFSVGQLGPARENYEQAVQLANQKLRVNPKDPDVNLLLAVYMAMLRQKDAAASHLDRALRLQPDEGEFFFWASIVQLRLGNRPKAMEWLHKARSSKYSPAEIRAAPEFDGLRDDPEFKSIISK